MRVEGDTAVVIPINNCAIVPTTNSTWPLGMSYLVAHELVHLLGAVAECAPHHVNGHVNDDPRDVLYEGPLPRVWDNLMLDVGHDDYYAHSDAGCADISTSPFLTN